MKKVYLSILGIAALTCGYSQTNIERVGFETRVNNFERSTLNSEVKINSKQQATEKAVGDIVWSEDFNGSINGWTTGGAEGAVWMFDLDGPNGPYSNPNQLITSPTASNGFLMFDADVYGGANNYPVINGYITSPAIDMSSTDALTLSFYTAYRYCCSSTPRLKMQISTDDFTTNKEYTVEDEAVGVNDFSSTIQVNINLVDFLSTATNKTNAKIRFVWDGFDSYHWQIDDIAITESVANDIEISGLILNRVFGDDNTIYTNLKEYTSIPLILADVLSVQAFVKNNGLTGVPSNASLNLSIYDDQKSLIAQEVGGAVSASVNKAVLIGDTISFDTSIDLAQLSPGTYKVFVDLATGDDNTDNDTMSRTLIISDNYLGQENYDIDLTEAASNGYRSTGAPAYFTIGNEFFFPAINSLSEVAIDGLEITLAQSGTYTTTPNTEVEVKIYEVQSNPTTYIEVDQPRLFDITSDMIPAAGQTNTVILNFHHAKDLTGAIYLPTDKKYVVGVYHPGGANNNFSYAVQKTDPDYTSRTYLKSSTTSTDTWFWNGEQFLSRLVFDQTLGLKDNQENVSVGNIYPNPTTGISKISYSLQNSSKVNLKVVDVTGKIVYTSNEGQQNSGNHVFNLDATEFNNGVYYVTIATDEEIVTKKLIKK